MIHYHGTPVGGKADERWRFLRGKHGLVSFMHQDDMATVAEVCQSFILDNGAFTAWRQGISPLWEDYYKWVRVWHKHPGFDFALIPDVIDGDEATNDKLLQQWPFDLPGVPVWHMHESISRLDRLSQQYPTVALGSSGQWDHPGSNLWWGRMTEIMDALCDKNGVPPCNLHGLRMLSPKVFTRLPLASADSVNASVNAGSLKRFGIYVPTSRWQRACVIADRVETFNSAPLWGAEGAPTTYEYDED